MTPGDDRPSPWASPGAVPAPWSGAGAGGRPAPWPADRPAGDPDPWHAPADGSAGDPDPWHGPAGGGYPPIGAHPPPGAPGWGSGAPSADPYWTPQPPRRGSINVIVTAILVVVAALAGVAIGSGLPKSAHTASAGGQAANNGSGGTGATLPGNGASTPGGATSPGATVPGPSNVSAIATKVDPGLVDIDTQLGYQQLAAAGTGIVLSSTGLILTNNHVVNGSTLIRVTDIGNRKVYHAVVVGYDESSDIALVQLQGASGLTTAHLGDSTSASIGEQVVAIGNAGGTGGTPSAAGGSVTALGQSIVASDSGDGTSERLQGLIQTNANVQPGDSGGSLVNTDGAVIGVDTAASQGFSFNSSGGAEGYAIPINTASVLARQIVAQHGSASIHLGPTAFLGVSFLPAAAGGGLSNSVYKVIPGTAANQAGITAGDVITGFGPVAVKSPGDLTKALVTYHPGDRVLVTWSTPHDGSHRANVTLTEGPNA